MIIIEYFRACAEWLQKCCKHRLCELKITENETKEDDVMVENACRILEYMSDVIAALKMTNEQDLDNASYRPNSPTSNNESGDPQGKYFLFHFNLQFFISRIFLMKEIWKQIGSMSLMKMTTVPLMIQMMRDSTANYVPSPKPKKNS